MKKRIVTVLLLAVALNICACAKTEQPPTNAPTEVQTTTEAQEKRLTADEVVALFNEKFDLLSETCEFDADTSYNYYDSGLKVSTGSFSGKCKYIDGKVNYELIFKDGHSECYWGNTFFQIVSGKITRKYEVSAEDYFFGCDNIMPKHIDSYDSADETETDLGTEYLFKLPDTEGDLQRMFCNREIKILVDNSGKIVSYEYRHTYIQPSEYETGKTYAFDENEGVITTVKINSTENVQIDLSQYEEEINSFVPAD